MEARSTTKHTSKKAGNNSLISVFRYNCTISFECLCLLFGAISTVPLIPPVFNKLSLGESQVFHNI